MSMEYLYEPGSKCGSPCTPHKNATGQVPLLFHVYRQRNWNSEKMEITWGHTISWRAETPTLIWLQRHTPTHQSKFLWIKSLQGYARNGTLVSNTPYSFSYYQFFQLQGHTTLHMVGRDATEYLDLMIPPLFPSLLAAPKLFRWVFLWHGYFCENSQLGFTCFCFHFSLFPILWFVPFIIL